MRRTRIPVGSTLRPSRAAMQTVGPVMIPPVPFTIAVTVTPQPVPATPKVVRKRKARRKA